MRLRNKDEVNNELLAIKGGDGYATGVAIGIYNNSERYIPLNHKTGFYPITDKIDILKFIKNMLQQNMLFYQGK